MMFNKLEAKMNDAYRQLRNELFCEETGLIYDSICSAQHEERFGHLPYIDEIQANVPNPHGYATGMEDSMLNAGFAIELCIQRAKAEPETQAETEDFARRLVHGMIRCASINGHNGYVVRSISPRDLKSCYMESSRDQFTLFVYGLWRYYHSGFAKLAEQEVIKNKLAEVADFVDGRMSEEFQYNLGRLDGYPAMHLNMIDCQSHEAMRLPMFFAAAYDVTGHSRYLELYQKYYPDAMAKSLKMYERTKPWWHIELSQMQVSLALCKAVDQDSEHQKSFDQLMMAIAEKAEKQTYEYHFLRMVEYDGVWNPYAKPWRDADNFILQRFNDDHDVLKGGKLYLKGEESDEFKDAFDRLRAPGNMIVTMLLSNNYQAKPEFWSRFQENVCVPEYKGHTSGGLVNILCTYYMAKNKIDFKRC